MSCDNCPCPAACRAPRGWADYCRWAAEQPPDPVKLRHICEASAAAPAPAAASYPPVATMAGNLAGSLWAWAVDGFKVAPPEEQARRRAICAACPEWVPEDRRCKLCGCATDAKVALRSAHCPLPEPKW